MWSCTSEGSQPFPPCLSPPTAPNQPPQGPRLPAQPSPVVLNCAHTCSLHSHHGPRPVHAAYCGLVWPALRRQSPGPLDRECQAPRMWFQEEDNASSEKTCPLGLGDSSPHKEDTVRGGPEHRGDSAPILRARKRHSLTFLKLIYGNPSPHPLPHHSVPFYYHAFQIPNCIPIFTLHSIPSQPCSLPAASSASQSYGSSISCICRSEQKGNRILR